MYVVSSICALDVRLHMFVLSIRQLFYPSLFLPFVALAFSRLLVCSLLHVEFCCVYQAVAYALLTWLFSSQI